MFEHLPGGEILQTGLHDLQAGVRSVPALLVLVGAPRLMRCGVLIPRHEPSPGLPEHELYELLVREHGAAQAHGRYGAWLRKLVSLENALDSLNPENRAGQ
jgi:hypothetical protein